MILYGKPVAEKIYTDIKKEIKDKKLKPYMAVILVGETPASTSFIKIKQKIAKKMGIVFRLFSFPEIVREDEIVKLISDLNQNEFVHGIMVQLPLPEKIDTEGVIKKITPEKDIDGLLGLTSSPAASAISEILKYYKIELENKKIILVGRGRLVGEPLKKLLENMDLKPQVCNNKTVNLKNETLKADILISATGKPGLITTDMVKNDAVIIDGGTAEAAGKIAGDVEKSVHEKVYAASPVPGGVGPVTVACLMRNLVKAAKKAK